MSSEVLAAKEAEASRGRLRAVWPQKCVFVVEEILKTEQDYVTSLRQIIEVGNVGGGGEGNENCTVLLRERSARLSGRIVLWCVFTT